MVCEFAAELLVDEKLLIDEKLLVDEKLRDEELLDDELLDNELPDNEEITDEALKDETREDAIERLEESREESCEEACSEDCEICMNAEDDDISEADEKITTEAALDLTSILDTEMLEVVINDENELSLEDTGTFEDSCPPPEESVELAPQAVKKIARIIAGYFT